jgi:L-rhamnose mutarotase
MGKVMFGQLGRLKRDKIDEYCGLHANPWPAVLKTITDCHLQNYSIFLQDDLVFAYFEYVGQDYDADMEKMAQDLVTQQWWTHTKPCFEKFAIDPGSEFYHDMKQIFYLA